METAKKAMEELFGWVASTPSLIVCGIVLFFIIVGIVNDRRKR